MHPSGEVGRFQMDNLSSPPGDWKRIRRNQSHMSPEHEFLTNRVEALAQRVGDLFAFAESALSYIASDPQSSFTKSRVALEKLLLTLFRHEMKCEPKRPMLGGMSFTAHIPRRILARMNAVRDMSNLGPHGECVDTTDATRVMRDLLDILQWYAINYQPIDKSDAATRSSDAVEILSDLKAKYPNCLRPDLTSVRFLQSPDRCYLEMTTADVVGGYLHNETTCREDLAFISDGDANLFDPANSITENARRFAFEMAAISIINCTDLFPTDIAQRIDKEWRLTGKIPPDL